MTWGLRQSVTAFRARFISARPALFSNPRLVFFAVEALIPGAAAGTRGGSHNAPYLPTIGISAWFNYFCGRKGFEIIMKKGLIVTICIVAVLALIAGACVSSYNGLVGEREKIDGLLANIDTQLQRRNDLIPNLVNTVKGYTTHESEVLANVSVARAKLAGAGTTAEKSEADSELSGALSRLLMVVENYPELKADTQFSALTDELAGTENRIAVSRKDYNDAAQKYNAMIKKFPKVIFANLFGFEKADYFQAAEGADQAPTVNFD